MNIVLHGDATSDEEVVYEETKVETNDAENEFLQVVVEGDAQVHVHSIQIVPEESKARDDESWKRTSIFSTILSC